jgi:hypothetical protein
LWIEKVDKRLENMLVSVAGVSAKTEDDSVVFDSVLGDMIALWSLLLE